MHKLVVGGAEQRIAGVGSEPGLVDQRLRVFDAETDGKRLGFHEDAGRVQHGEGVTRAVTEGEDDLMRHDCFAVHQRHALYGAVFDLYPGDTALETDFAAQRDDFGAHALNHADEAEGADVGMCDVEDFLRRPRLDELLQDLAPEKARVFHLAVELAVREGSGATFTELNVRFRVELVAAPQLPGVLRAFAHGLATFENDRSEAHLRQQQRGEDAGRAEADDDRAVW